MQNVMPESLQNTQNDWTRIYRESGSLQELLMATYSRALEPDCFEHYKPRRVFAPKDWPDAYGDYLAVSLENKSKVWRGIQEKFYGYLKAKHDADAENKSDMFFLTKMQEFFKANNMPAQAEKCRLRLLDFAV